MPILFSCPHCGAKTNVPDEFAGRSGPCASCGKPITIPGTPGAVAPPRQGLGAAGTVLIVLGSLFVVVFVCGGILLALLLPAVQAAREAARRAQCSNNLKQIALALHNYHDTYGEFPPAYFTDENGTPTHSWRVMILPFLESAPLYSQYSFDEPWDGPNNSQLAGQMPTAYRCASAPATSSNTTGYMAIVGPGTAWPGAQSQKIMQITDGTSNTILVAEVAGSQVNWMAPTDLDVTRLPMAINAAKDGTAISSHHPGGAQAAFADGSTRFLTETISPQTLQGLITAQGGEVVQVP
jgi:prepilin-type processing-associated H-X9-DG protein